MLRTKSESPPGKTSFSVQCQKQKVRNCKDGICESPFQKIVLENEFLPTYTFIFYKQPVYRELAFGTYFDKQLLGLNHLQ